MKQRRLKIRQFVLTEPCNSLSKKLPKLAEDAIEAEKNYRQQIAETNSFQEFFYKKALPQILSVCLLINDSIYSCRTTKLCSFTENPK